MQYSKELETARNAAKEASEKIRSLAKSGSFKTELKGKNDLVTSADLASEEIIIKTITKHFPGDKILAEESSEHLSLPSGRVWIIDPIDGTTNFAHGFPPYCISIALWEDAEPKVALVVELARDEWFWAAEGEGAWLGDEQLHVSETKKPEEALIATGFPYSMFDLVDPYLQLLRSLMKKTHGIRRPGAASYDLCCVAAGRVEGFYEYGLSPWDTAAGALIILEAGGVVTDWRGENEWLFGKRIICGNEYIRSFLQKEIRLVFREAELSI